MTLPTIRGVSSGVQATLTTAHSTDLPVTANENDYVVVLFTVYEDEPVSDFDGLTQMDNAPIAGLGRSYLLYGRLSAGQTELNFVTTNVDSSVTLIYHFDQNASLVGFDAANGSDDSPTPPIPAIELGVCYQFAACAWLGNFSLTAYNPSGDNEVTDRISTGETPIGAAAAKKTVSATEYPSNFTLSASASWLALSWQVEYASFTGGTGVSLTAEADVVFGGDFGETSIGVSSINAVMLHCCGGAQGAAAACVFGSVTWDAEPQGKGDGIARYYPLWLNARDVAKATRPILDPAKLAALRATGRDIAHQLDAGGLGQMQDSVDGKMCEIPEQFRLGRYYEVPLTPILSPQPVLTDPLVLQWEWSRGFTMSMLFRYRPVRQEQTLFSLSPVVRFGVSWLGELAIELTLENGDKLNAWSTQRLSQVDWSHIACTYDPDRQLVAMHLNGARVIELEFTRAIGDVDGCYIGKWDNGSLMNGDAQDVRIYNSVVRNEFIAAEVNSYCADWVEVV